MWYQSKKIWVLVVGSAVMAANQWLGLGLDDSTVTKIAAVAAAYLAGQGLADFGKHKG